MIINKDTNLDKFWLVNDGLNMTSNLYFGLGKSYFCGHGCKVCFIHDELKAMKGKTSPIYNNDLELMTKTWNELYSFFDTIALDEDPYYFKFFHRKEYDWYLKNASKCSYGTTDNGIFRISKLKDIKFKSMFEVALSMTFIEKVGHQKILDCLEKLLPIQRVKFLVDKPNIYPTEIIEWVRSKNLAVVVHKLDFLTGVETEFDTMGFDMIQDVNWVVGRKGAELVKVHINSDVIVYYDNFYFSNNVGDIPYYSMTPESFNYKDFLSNMLIGKQKNYLTYSELIDDGYLKDYFLNTQKYKVNHDYNFIPNFMIDYKIKFFNRMQELDWTATKYGLIQGNPDKIIPIIEKL